MQNQTATATLAATMILRSADGRGFAYVARKGDAVVVLQNDGRTALVQMCTGSRTCRIQASLLV